ncbi:MAG: hypothetical protein V9G22_11345, partial [Ottowia sp.]
MSGGNRCGHDPCCPRWFEPPAHHAPHPKILVKLQAAVRAYFADPAVLPSLNAANGSARRQRSERREACLALLGALVHYLDLVTLRVGIPQADGSFQGLTLEFLAERAGLGLRRAERACRDLRKAGLVEVYPIAQQDRRRPLQRAARHPPPAGVAVPGVRPEPVAPARAGQGRAPPPPAAAAAGGRRERGRRRAARAGPGRRPVAGNRRR